MGWEIPEDQDKKDTKGDHGFEEKLKEVKKSYEELKNDFAELKNAFEDTVKRVNDKTNDSKLVKKLSLEVGQL